MNQQGQGPAGLKNHVQQWQLQNYHVHWIIIIIIIALIPLTNKLNRADCGYQVHGTERKISHLLYMDDLKLLGRNKNDLKNEMKIVQTTSKDMNMNFGLEKCARICLKRGSVQSKMHVGSTFDNDIKELDSRKAYNYLGIEWERKAEKGILEEIEASFGYRIKCKE